jgi:biopolymer transport protein ExbD
MRFQQRLKPCHNLIDLTPLVDVIFLMLIFFLVTSEILPLKSLKIENPALKNVHSPANIAQLLVIMDRDQVIYIGSKKDIVDMNSVKEHLIKQIAVIKAQNPAADPAVVLNVDRHVDYGAFLRLFSTVQECSPHIRLSYKAVEQ